MSAGFSCRTGGPGLLGLLFASFFVLAPSVAPADDYYRWVDSKGRAHFSDSYYDVPERYRDQVDTKRSFEEQAEVSVVGGLDTRWLPKTPETSDEAEKDEAGSRFDPATLRDLRSPADLLARFGLAMLIGMGALLVGALLAGLALGALLLRLACRIVGEDQPGMWKAMGLLLLQTLLGAAAQGTLQVALVQSGSGVSPSAALSLLALNTLVGFSINVAVLRALLVETLGRALAVQIVLALLGLGIGLGLGVVVVLGAALLG